MQNNISAPNWFLDGSMYSSGDLFRIPIRSKVDNSLIGEVRTFDPSDEQIEKAKSNAAAIVSAVNNTYGIGLDPSMIPSMMEEFKTIVDTGHLVTKEAIITLVKYAIQKSKL